MTMTNRFFIAIALWATCLQGAIWPATVPAGFRYEFNVMPGHDSGSTDFAQNDQRKPPDSVYTDDASKTRDDTNKPKASAPEKTEPEKVKPVKPFVPSETIPADQGVDFPYDI